MKIPLWQNYKNGHSVKLLRSGEQYFRICEKAINESKKYIHFQTYIFDNDETGRRIINALINAAKRGVRVYFMLDAYGGNTFSKQLTDKIKKAGVFFRKFSPGIITKRFQLNLVLHHKVLLIDGDIAIIGGINVSNRYCGTSNLKEWLDFAILIKGPECSYVLLILKRLWNKKFISKKERSHEIIRNPAYYENNIKVKVMQNNWYRNKIDILKSYRSSLKNAQNRIIIFASYFLPGRNERKILKDASQRGVNIKIVLSAKSDIPIFKKATSFLYDFILRNNIKIYEYLPSNMHAKVAAIDGIWSTIGSYNINHLSDYSSIEMNANVFDAHFTGQFERILLEIIKKDCRQIISKDYIQHKNWFYQFSNWFSYQIMRILMRFMFLFIIKPKNRISRQG